MPVIQVRQQISLFTYENLLGGSLPNVDDQLRKYKRKLNKLLKDSGVVFFFSEDVVDIKLSADRNTTHSTIDLFASAFGWKQEYFHWKNAQRTAAASALIGDVVRATVSIYVENRKEENHIL